MTPHMIEKVAHELLNNNFIFCPQYLPVGDRVEILELKDKVYSNTDLIEVKKYLKRFDEVIKLTHKPKLQNNKLHQLRENIILPAFKQLFMCYCENKQISSLIEKSLLKVDDDFIKIIYDHCNKYPCGENLERIKSFYEKLNIENVVKKTQGSGGTYRI